MPTQKITPFAAVAQITQASINSMVGIINDGLAAFDTHTHTASDVGERPDDWLPSADDVGAVPTSRKINGKALTADVTLTAGDVGARPSNWLPSADDVGAVPTTRTVNSKALSSNVTLTASDVGARRTYSALSELGIAETDYTTAETMAIAIANAMENNSTLACSLTNIFTAGVFPANYGQLIVNKVAATYVSYTYFHGSSGAISDGYYNSGASSGSEWSGWQPRFSPVSGGVATLDANGKVQAAQACSRVIAKSASTTLTLADAGALTLMTSTSALTITIPADATVNFPIGTEMEFCRWNTGAVTFVAASGVTAASVDNAKTIGNLCGYVAIKKLTTNTWLLSGDLG